MDRLGPAIAPTAAKRIIEIAPAAAAEGVKPPKAMVAKRSITKSEDLGLIIRRAYKLTEQRVENKLISSYLVGFFDRTRIKTLSLNNLLRFKGVEEG